MAVLRGGMYHDRQGRGVYPSPDDRRRFENLSLLIQMYPWIIDTQNQIAKRNSHCDVIEVDGEQGKTKPLIRLPGVQVLKNYEFHKKSPSLTFNGMMQVSTTNMDHSIVILSAINHHQYHFGIVRLARSGSTNGNDWIAITNPMLVIFCWDSRIKLRADLEKQKEISQLPPPESQDPTR